MTYPVTKSKHKITAMLWLLCTARNIWCPVVWQQQQMLQTPVGRGESCAVPWLHQSSERKKAPLTLTVFCPHCCCQAGDRVLAVCGSHHWHWWEAGHQQPAYVPMLSVGRVPWPLPGDYKDIAKWPITVFGTEISV